MCYGKLFFQAKYVCVFFVYRLLILFVLCYKYNIVLLNDMEEVMRKIFKGISVALTMTLALGLFTGCGNKTKEVTYDYNAEEYIKLGNYKGVEVELEDYTVTDADLQDVIEQIKEKYVEYHVVDRVAQDGDMVVVTFDAYISGGKVEGFSGEDYNVIIGSNEFLVEGFEEALIGLGAGEKRAITGLKVPENFSTEEKYAGRAITFNIDIAGVYEPVLPEYNDELVTKVSDGEYTTVDAFNANLMSMLEENAVTNRYNEKYNEILDVIVDNTEIIKDFPAEYVESKSAGVQKEVDRYTVLYSMDTSEYLMKYYGVETVEEAAKNQIMLEFVFQAIIQSEDLKITEDEYNKNLLATAQERNYTTTEKFVEDYTEMGAARCMLLDKAVDVIMESAVEK